MECELCGRQAVDGVTYKYIAPDGEYKVYVCPDCMTRLFFLMEDKKYDEILNEIKERAHK